MDWNIALLYYEIVVGNRDTVFLDCGIIFGNCDVVLLDCEIEREHSGRSAFIGKASLAAATVEGSKEE